MLAHLCDAGGGESALLALPAKADVLQELLLAEGGESAELAHVVLLGICKWNRNSVEGRSLPLADRCTLLDVLLEDYL